MITKYEVQHYTLCDGWINTWTTYDDNDNEIPIIYDTHEDAEEALDNFLSEEKKAFKRGEIDNMYEADEFRIEEVAL
jgi:hypothetical protein